MASARLGCGTDPEGVGNLAPHGADEHYGENYLDRYARLIRQAVPADVLPGEPDLAPLFRIYAVLLLAMGERVSAADVHNAWAAWMAERRPSHPQLKPYVDLERDVAARDQRYVDAIREVARLMVANRQR